MWFPEYKHFFPRWLVDIIDHATRRSVRGSRRRWKVKSAPILAQTECLETRQMLAADDLTALSDDFEDAATQSNWQRLYQTEGWAGDQLQTWDVNGTQSGRMVMIPHTTVWYQDYRGPMVYKEITGDFVITTQVHITDRDDVGDSDLDDVPNGSQYSLGGLMIRTPRDITDPAVDWSPGSHQNDGTNNGENYIFLSLGWGNAGSQFQMETKTTRNSNSSLVLQSMGNNAVIQLQIARIGDSAYTLYQIPGQDWVLNSRYHRPDLPETLQVGMVTYTDWTKANDYDPFYQNNNTLQPGGYDPTPAEAFQPDLVAGYEFVHFDRPEIPVALQGLDLRTQASDQEILSFLGENVNGPDLPTVTLETSVLPVEELSSSQLEFVFQRSAAQIDQPLTVAYQISGSATPGLDFQSLSGEITFAAETAMATLVVDILEDFLDEPDESLAIQLLAGNDYLLGETTFASGTIVDNDYTNVAPVASPIVDQDLTEGDAFNLDVSPYLTDANVPDGDQLTLMAALSNGDPLPGWLIFNAVTGVFSGVPPFADVGSIEIEVTAADLAGLTDSVLFQLTVAPLPRTQLQLRVVKSATSVAANGESLVLPAHTEDLQEWESFQVEVWGQVSNLTDVGIVFFRFDLNYATAYTTASFVEFGPAFTQNQSALIDDASGLVQGISARTLAIDVGDDQSVLLARIHFAPTVADRVDLDLESQSIGPVDSGLTLENVSLELVEQVPHQLENSDIPATQFWAVPYDVNDDGAINFQDLVLFATAYQHDVADSPLPYTWAVDFNQSGRVDFHDLLLLAANYGRTKLEDPELYLPASYPHAWIAAPLVSSFSATETQPAAPLLSHSTAVMLDSTGLQGDERGVSQVGSPPQSNVPVPTVEKPDLTAVPTMIVSMQWEAATPQSFSPFAAADIDPSFIHDRGFTPILDQQNRESELSGAGVWQSVSGFPAPLRETEVQQGAGELQEIDGYFSLPFADDLLSWG
ncbi:MAG: putative Ig domain-containing protein [bacterium]|nr:putative Ig domain-containing protein [bacterium]